nr:nucleotidyltransferase domain-containing protein [uncultured Rhodopila sp.]
MSVSRLAADTRLTPNGTRGVLADLERAGIVESLGDSHTKLFQAVPEHPLVTAMAALFAAERQRFETILSAVTAAAADDRIAAAWLFGSVARAEDTIGSDLDIAILVDSGAEQVDAVADGMREALRKQGQRPGFSASVIAMHPAGMRRLVRERAPLWADLLRYAVMLKGAAPDRVAREFESMIVRVGGRPGSGSSGLTSGTNDGVGGARTGRQ